MEVEVEGLVVARALARIQTAMPALRVAIRRRVMHREAGSAAVLGP